MPYWIEQTKGQIKNQIDAIAVGYRSNSAGVKETFAAYFNLYKQMRGKQPHAMAADASQAYDELVTERGEFHIEYLVTTWFPFYINFFYEGPERNCYARKAELERLNPGEKYQVAYEY